MLYELIAAVRPGKLADTMDIAKTVGQTVLRGGGVIRGYTYWGVFHLPKPTTKHQTRHTHGDHFIMRFDSSAEVQQQIRSTLSLNPRMIRFGVVKLGERLDQIKDVAGTVEWNEAQKATMTRYFTSDTPKASSG